MTEAMEDDIEAQKRGQLGREGEAGKPTLAVAVDAQAHAAALVDDEAIARELQDQELARLRTVDKFERSIRHGFVRKVFGILALQVLVMMGITSIFMYVPALRAYAKDNVWLLLAFGGVLIVFIVSLSCCGEIHKRFPYNLYLLLSIAVMAGGLFGTIAARVENPDYVWACFGTTAVVMLSLGLFAMQEYWDFAGTAPFVCVGTIVVVTFVVLGAATGFAGFVFVAIIVLFFSMYVVYDMQLVIGGKHRYHQFGVDDYALAALTLYTDFLVIFWIILACGGGVNQ